MKTKAWILIVLLYFVSSAQAQNIERIAVWQLHIDHDCSEPEYPFRYIVDGLLYTQAVPTAVGAEVIPQTNVFRLAPLRYFVGTTHNYHYLCGQNSLTATAELYANAKTVRATKVTCRGPMGFPWRDYFVEHTPSGDQFFCGKQMKN